MNLITIYNIDTGKIRGTFRSISDEDLPLNIRDNESYVEGEFSGRYFYIKDGVVYSKDNFSVSVIGNKLINVPEYTEIVSNHFEDIIIMDSSEELELDMIFEETITLHLTHPKFLDHIVEISND